MGRFFTSTQIYNPKQLDRDAFAASFCKKMKQEGYELCEAECAELSYVLAFADNCKWVTISSEAYEQGNQTSQADTARIARMLGTYCVSTIVIDSDCAILDLYDDKGKKADTAVMGRADDYFGDDIPEPIKAVWEQFLSAGSTWEQLTAVMQGSYVFVEDGLAELAPMIGMDSRRILFAFENVNENDANVQFLSFKKTDSKQEKKLTLNSAFVKVFGDGLAPLGFVRLKKTKLPFFVRLINGELLQIVTYRQLSAKKVGYKRFEVLGGIVSLYRNTISFEKEPQLWLKTNGRYYRSECAVPVDDLVKKKVIQFNCDIWGTSMKMYSEPERFEEGFTENIYTFLCKADDNEEMLKGLQNAFDVTRAIMVPIFEKVTDLHSCIEYFYRIHENMYLSENLEELKTSDSEGLTMIAAGYRGDFVPFMEHWLAKEVKEVENGTRGAAGAGTIDAYWERGRKRIQERVAIRDRMLNDLELNAKVMEELERRKAENLIMLQSYGMAMNVTTKKEKKLTLNSAFVKVFGDGLAPLGFVRLKKTKVPFFVRLINGELLQIVTYREKAKRKDGYKTFEVLGGIVSLYRRTIDFTKSPELWLKSNHYYHSKWDAELNNDVKKQAIKMGYSMSENQTIPVGAFEEAFKKSIISFLCKTDDNVSLLNGMKNAFDVTAHIMIPIFDQVNTYNSCIDFLYKYYSGWLELAELDEFIENDRYSVSEGLLLILANYRDDGIERIKKELSERIPFLGKQEDAEKLKLHYENKRAEQIAIRNMMLDDPQLNAKVMKELERRKAENIAVLKLHGIG